MTGVQTCALPIYNKALIVKYYKGLEDKVQDALILKDNPKDLKGLIN